MILHGLRFQLYALRGGHVFIHTVVDAGRRLDRNINARQRALTATEHGMIGTSNKVVQGLRRLLDQPSSSTLCAYVALLRG